MLQTCTRCRTRRIKCDSSLPACANCDKSDLECTFRDDALQEEIPRRYVKALNDRIQELSSELALHKHSSPSASADVPIGTSSSSAGALWSYVLIPGTGQYMHIGLSFPSLITQATFDVLPSCDSTSESTTKPEHDLHLKDNPKLDRSTLTPSIIRFLLSRYDRCVRPKYDIPIPELSNQEGTLAKKIPEPQRFKSLMGCAIAAARESYRYPHWKAVSQLCRDWADESISSIISSWDGESLSAILLLLVYELADPSRGIAWELLDLATRTCLQLGWHRMNATMEIGTTFPDNAAGNDKARLMSVLKNVEGSLRVIFDRPNMLREAIFSRQSENDQRMQIFSEALQEIYGTGQLLETQGCPFVGRSVTLMDILDNSATDDNLISETWILFMPVCVKHKQCVFCFQEDDEPNKRGMRALRQTVIDSASRLLLVVHQESFATDKFIPPIVASSKALASGCVLATSIAKKWTEARYHIQDLLRCSEILTSFEPHWKGGQSYLSIWRRVMSSLQLSQA